MVIPVSKVKEIILSRDFTSKEFYTVGMLMDCFGNEVIHVTMESTKHKKAYNHALRLSKKYGSP